MKEFCSKINSDVNANGWALNSEFKFFRNALQSSYFSVFEEGWVSIFFGCNLTSMLSVVSRWMTEARRFESLPWNREFLCTELNISISSNLDIVSRTTSTVLWRVILKSILKQMWKPKRFCECWWNSDCVYSLLQ